MKTYILTTIIYSISVLSCAAISVKLGGELILQLGMYYFDVEDRLLLPEKSGIQTILIVALIPEVLIGSISGWYLGEWLSKK